MKKFLLTIGACALLAGSALAQGNAPQANNANAATTDNGANISAPVVPRHALPPITPGPGEGAIQRGVRLGNPLQLINPMAPSEYGSGRDFVVYRAQGGSSHTRHADRPADAPVAWKLFSFTFW